MSTVIVFGPTGRIASVVACTAREQGAKVFLAMRDPQRPVPGLSPQRERREGFERVQADLTNPESIAAAVKTSGAKRAFLYAAFDSSDHMRASLAVLKSAGINFVVFLSSCTVQGDPHDVSPSELIGYLHAQIEVNLEDIFGLENFIAVRPGDFVTNQLRFHVGIQAGEVGLLAPDYKLDCITPEDIGRVSGMILATDSHRGPRGVFLFGPQIITQREAIKIMGKVLGKHIGIRVIDEQEALEQYLREKMPEPVARYMVQVGGIAARGLPRVDYEINVHNVRQYTGRPAVKFEEWMEANKELFA